MLATVDPPDHQRQRKVVARKLSTSSMRAMEPEFRSLVVDALSDIPADGRFEWMSRVAEPLPMVMVARILGLPDELAPDLKKQGYAMVERISGFVPEHRIEQLENDGINGLAAVIDAYTQAREGSTSYDDGMIGIVARAVEAGELDDVEALGVLNLLISAGGESTTSLTGTGVRILAEQPQLQDKFRAILRWSKCSSRRPSATTRPSVATTGSSPRRRAGRQATPCRIAPGAHVAGRQSRPSRLRPPRRGSAGPANPRQHVAFGWGIHLCVGAPLARIEAKVAIETLLARTRRFRIDPTAEPLLYHSSLMVRRLLELPLVLELRE